MTYRIHSHRAFHTFLLLNSMPVLATSSLTLEPIRVFLLIFSVSVVYILFLRFIIIFLFYLFVKKKHTFFRWYSYARIQSITRRQWTEFNACCNKFICLSRICISCSHLVYSIYQKAEREGTLPTICHTMCKISSIFFLYSSAFRLSLIASEWVKLMDLLFRISEAHIPGAVRKTEQGSLLQ